MKDKLMKQSFHNDCFWFVKTFAWPFYIKVYQKSKQTKRQTVINHLAMKDSQFTIFF